MICRTLGRTGFSVSEISFGAWGIGGNWGARDDAEAARALQRAFDLGVNFYDTALAYGQGLSEKFIGEFVKGRRAQVFVASKIPPKTYRWPVLPGEPVTQTFPKAWIIECTERSLKNLRTDYLDVQQLHAWTDAYTQQLDWLEAFDQLKREGKIRAWGVSANDWDPYGPVNAMRAGLFDTVQVLYNLWEQRPAEEMFPAAQEKNVGLIVRVPFEEGVLTGAFGPDHAFEATDWRRQWLTPARLAEAARRVDKLRPFLNEDRPTLAALALKFCLSHPAVSTVIPGMRKVVHVEANGAVSDGRLLNETELAELKHHAFAHGWKYPWAQA
jgi:aryl-alcohol dehydrogenase-like predicted oxidoreductase